ncbi:MAG TPA: diguanylate cyclase [Candidatus Acidoferrales bacterium]|nr:diguanylate cyclase [Candidatus Acidoferrales bacterium]
MAQDVGKNLDRAKKLLEKNRVEDAIEAYLAVLKRAPNHLEATQALGDLYARIEQPDRAAVYYGMLFDLLIEPRDETKALALYGRFLRSPSVQQPPERIARYGYLLQRQNRSEEAMEQFVRAAELFTGAGREEDALFCLERVAQLDPDNLARQLRLAEAAAHIRKDSSAARAFLRAAQIASASGAEADALKLFGRAHQLAPGERSAALLYAEAKLRGGAAVEAVALLEPFSTAETDAPFQETFAEALTKAGQLDRARGILEKLLKEKESGQPRLFGLADAYAAVKEDAKAVEILLLLKGKMSAEGRINDFAAQMDAVGEHHRDSAAILEFWADLYNELNRESRYFETLLSLFDAYLKAGAVEKAREALERLVDIDAYDYRNHERLERLRGRVDDSYLKSLEGRLARTAPGEAPAPPAEHPSARESEKPLTEDGRAQQELDDLMVQSEIFVQYSLHSKAVERLQKIAGMFPGEEERNARLRTLYELANWWPPGAKRPKPEPDAGVPVAAAEPVTMPAKTGTYSPETLRDLTKIREITQKIYRQQTPQAMLNTTVNEVATYLGATRALAVIGVQGRPLELAAEYCAPGVEPAPGVQVVFLIAQMEKAGPDALGGLVVEASKGSALAGLGLTTALGVLLTDKETQAAAGMLIAAHEGPRNWKPNETYFLQAVGDQMLMSVSHTRLRSLVRRMGVSDARTGLLSRSSYLECLLTEAARARAQGTPLSLMILQIDRGAEILRQRGESSLEQFVEQIARSLQLVVRQNDISVKYTAWSLAYILPDTTLASGRPLADKLRRNASSVKAPWAGGKLTLSAGIVQAIARADYENEDVVTDLVNRAEASLDEARRRGGETIVALDTPKP